MNNRIFLPKLKHISIKNYSLYSEDIEYDFIDGVNLIIGGNGVGKTTFINILKYALIGLYKKDLTVRNYQGEKRLSRETYSNCNTYFRDRTKNLTTDINASVTLKFSINNCDFEVNRSLYDTMLVSASYSDNGQTYDIPGEPIRQDVYFKFENDKEDKKIGYLQYNYEQYVAQKANMTDFNDFIFFVNQILLFGEDRLNVLWDHVAQSRLLSNYLNDKELEKQRKECKLEEKYQDSIARHKQEEIKAIRKVLESLNVQKSDKNDQVSTIIDLSTQIDDYEKRISSTESSIKNLQKNAEVLYKKIADLSVAINEKETEKNKIEASMVSDYWPGINRKYMVYKDQIERNHICPICNNHIDTHSFNMDTDKCFFCNSIISSEKNPQFDFLKKELKELMEKRQNYEHQVLDYDEEINGLYAEQRNYRQKLFKLRKQLSELEAFSQEKNKMEEETAYVAMVSRIDELTIEKTDAQQKCEQLKNQGQSIMELLDKNLIESTRYISEIFNKFANAFLHLPCYLTVDKHIDSGVNLFVPVIDGKPRYTSDELSESQRFFIDYSFRMSILMYFYNDSSFYICETPDSSLDISYEENAANTLVKYTEKPNVLIITSNLNNSVFIKHLLSKANKKNILNLLKYGKVSSVQINNEALQTLSKEIEVLANEQSI